jgi:glycerol-3-phosphate O-acyltransferase
MKKRYGKVHVSFAEPIFLDDMLDEHAPGWRDSPLEADHKPSWLSPLVNRLGNKIMTAMNEAAHVNAINLLAVVLLTMKKQAMAKEELLDQLTLYLSLLEHCRYSERITYTGKSEEDIISYGIELGVIEVRQHPLGDIIALAPDHAVQLTYFRNNISHLVALPSLVASCFLNERTIERAKLHRAAQAIYPFLKSELYLPWSVDELSDTVDNHIEWLKNQGLLLEHEESGILERAEGSTQKAQRLRIMGHGQIQTFERFYITIAILAKNGSGALTRSELERLCILTAQRISQLSEFGAPEFYDRNLFRQFIAQLRENGALTTNPEEKLEFGEMITQMSEDAKIILSKDIRHSIMRVAPQILQDPDSESDK